MVSSVLVGGLYVILEAVNMFVQATQSRSVELMTGPTAQKLFLWLTGIEGNALSWFHGVFSMLVMYPWLICNVHGVLLVCNGLGVWVDAADAVNFHVANMSPALRLLLRGRGDNRTTSPHFTSCLY